MCEWSSWIWLNLIRNNSSSYAPDAKLLDIWDFSLLSQLFTPLWRLLTLSQPEGKESPTFNVICVHFNAESWGNPYSPTLTKKNHLHLLLLSDFLYVVPSMIIIFCLVYLSPYFFIFYIFTLFCFFVGIILRLDFYIEIKYRIK